MHSLVAEPRATELSASEWSKRQVSCPEFAARSVREGVRRPGERGRVFVTECFQAVPVPERFHREVGGAGVGRGRW